VDRWACVDVPALPLQLLLTRHPEWERAPVAIVSRDAPTGEVEWINDVAFRAGIRPGLRYTAALGLTGELRAGVVSPSEVEEGVAILRKCLGRKSPDVEPASNVPGVFWLNASGLTTLYPSLHAWARSVLATVRASGFRASVVVGFTRFGTYALTKTCPGVTVFTTREEESTAAQEVPLVRLDLAPDLAEMMDLLGVGTVGDFLCLPASGVRQRFGEEAYELHCRASGDLCRPIHPYRSRPPLYDEKNLEHPETESERLLSIIIAMLEPLLRELEKRGDALAEVRWMMVIETRERFVERVRPVEATLDLRQIAELVRLRLETLSLSAGVEEIAVAVISSAASSEQETLLRVQTRRNLSAGNRALARLRAAFGEASVVAAKLEDGHLPEASFRWEPVIALHLPHASSSRAVPLVRRFYAEPEQIPPACVNKLRSALGPFIVSGNWWMDQRYREYFFAVAKGEKLLWLYYDRMREAWFVQGEVE